MPRLVGVVTVKDLIEYLSDRPGRYEIKVAIGNAMETRLVVVPLPPERHGSVSYFMLPSYEEE